MFDSYLAPGPSSVRARPAVIAGAALAAHLALAGALVISNAWDIDKLALDDSRLTLAGPIPPSRPMAGGGDGQMPKKGESLEKKMGAKKKQGAKKAVTDVQPTDAANDDDEMIVGDTDGAPDGDDASEFGHPDGDKDGTGIGILVGDGRCPMPVCGTDVIPKDVEIPEVEEDKPVIVPSQWLDGHLVSGVEKIHPPDGVRREMQRDGQSQTRALVMMCLTKEGRVRSLDLKKSSGYSDYDATLLREMKRWRYTPYKMNGVAVEVCTAVTFIYRMR